MTPLVTAVIAVYRPGVALREAIASALSQSLGDVEVFVSDDGDDPAVRALAASFGDSRVVYRANPSRLGAARNHWSAFAAARGKYLAILNQDDLWRPEFLNRLAEPLERDRDLALAFCDHEVVDEHGNPLIEVAKATSVFWGRSDLAAGSHRPLHPLVVKQTIPIAMGSLLRRDALDSVSFPDVGPAYDLWLAYALARTGRGGWFVPERLSAWRLHPGQLTQIAKSRVGRGIDRMLEGDG